MFEYELEKPIEEESTILDSTSLLAEKEVNEIKEKSSVPVFSIQKYPKQFFTQSITDSL